MDKIKSILQDKFKYFHDDYHHCEELNTKNIHDIIYLDCDNNGAYIYFTFPETNDAVYKWDMNSNAYTMLSDRHILTCGQLSSLDGVELLPNSSNRFEYIISIRTRE